jgi:DNA-3-methyladenine glycosylase I
MKADKTRYRCAWAGDDAEYVVYHDREWGLAVVDDRRLFEFLILEGAQAGLSWLTILKRRSAYRRAFDHFDPARVARYDDEKRRALLTDAGIIRNRLKIEAAISNARAFLSVQESHNGFFRYLWQFVDGRPLVNQWRTLNEVPAQTALSHQLSRDLKQRGFKFVGPTICYALMQAVGMVNDHLAACFRYQAVQAESSVILSTVGLG